MTALVKNTCYLPILVCCTAEMVYFVFLVTGKQSEMCQKKLQLQSITKKTTVCYWCVNSESKDFSSAVNSSMKWLRSWHLFCYGPFYQFPSIFCLVVFINPFSKRKFWVENGSASKHVQPTIRLISKANLPQTSNKRTVSDVDANFLFDFLHSVWRTNQFKLVVFLSCCLMQWQIVVWVVDNRIFGIFDEIFNI